jgi:SP family general alpha glucoside:H+ symporter-like MFS transporter
MLSPAANNWGLKTSLLFGSCAAIVGILVFFVVPETKGRTYEQLDHLFVSKVPTRRFKSYQFEDDQSVASAQV